MRAQYDVQSLPSGTHTDLERPKYRVGHAQSRDGTFEPCHSAHRAIGVFFSFRSLGRKKCWMVRRGHKIEIANTLNANSSRERTADLWMKLRRKGLSAFHLASAQGFVARFAAVVRDAARFHFGPESLALLRGLDLRSCRLPFAR